MVSEFIQKLCECSAPPRAGFHCSPPPMPPEVRCPCQKYPVSMRQHAPNSGSGMCFRPTPQAEQQASSAPLGRGTPALLLRQGALVSHSDPRPKDTVSFFMTDGEPNATNTQNACLRPPADTDLEQRNWEIGDV